MNNRSQREKLADFEYVSTCLCLAVESWCSSVSSVRRSELLEPISVGALSFSALSFSLGATEAMDVGQWIDVELSSSEVTE